MLFGVIAVEDGRQVGIDHNGVRQPNLNDPDLMSLPHAKETADRYGGEIVGVGELFPYGLNMEAWVG